MEGKAEQQVREAHQEVALVMAQWRTLKAKASKRDITYPANLKDKGSAITNPSGFWATALTSTDSPKGMIENGILLATAKLRGGDLEFVLESGIGQVAWLSSLALELKNDADSQPIESAARDRLLRLSLKAQGAAAKLILSLGGLARMTTGDALLIIKEDSN